MFILNSYAVLYKKESKYNQSLQNLNLALQMLNSSENKAYIGLTYINLCSLYSKNNMYKFSYLFFT